MVWYIFAFASAIFSTLSALLEKQSLKKVHALQFSAAISILNFLFSLAFISYADFSIEKPILVVMYATSLVGTVAFLYIAKAVRHLDISLVSPLLNLNPAFVAVLAYLVLGESLTGVQSAGIVLIIFGAYVIEIDHSRHTLLDPILNIFRERHIFYAVLAAFLYAISSIGDKYILGHVNQFTYIIVMHFFIALNFTVLITVFHGGIKDIRSGYSSAGRWIFVMAISTLLYRLFQAWAVSLAFVSLVIPIKRLSTLFSTLAGGRIYKESGTGKRAIACVIMLLGAYLLII